MFRPAVASTIAVIAASSLAPPAPAQAQQDPQARIWVDGDRDLFRRGDRLQVRFTSSRDAYVAVIHVDTDGTLDFVYPTSPWDDGYVRGGRVYSAPQGRYSSWSVRSRSGIGYLYIVASDQPLDFSYFGGRHSRSWDWSYAGRNVMGDPYLALEQITRMLVPDWSYGGYSVDYYSYHVDRRHRYPAYACGGSGWGVHRGWGWTPHYGSCDRLVVFLGRYPGYYDTRRYRGDRRVYLRGAPLPEVRHGYKAPARASQGRGAVAPSTRGRQGSATPSRSTAPAEQPARRRPTLERRGETQARPAPRTGGSAGTSRPAAPARGETPRTGGARPAAKPAPRRSGGSGASGGSARPAPASPSPRSSGGTSRPPAAPRSRGSGGGASRPAAAPASRGSGGGESGGSEERPSTRGSRGGGGGS